MLMLCLLAQQNFYFFFPFQEFQTPEEFFLDEKPAKFDWGSIDPVEYLKQDVSVAGKSYHSEVCK